MNEMNEMDALFVVLNYLCFVVVGVGFYTAEFVCACVSPLSVAHVAADPRNGACPSSVLQAEGEQGGSNTTALFCASACAQ